jgi:hypothetical protein
MSTEQVSETMDQLLLDYHMGQLEPADRERVEEALQARPDLRAKSERLVAFLRPLAAWTPAPAPGHLVESVLDRIERHESTIPFDPTRSVPMSRSDVGLYRSLVSLREVFAIAASILIIVGVFVPSYYGVRQRTPRDVSQQYMNTLGMGMTNYAADNGGYRPVVAAQGASWLPRNPDGKVAPGAVWYPCKLTITRHIHTPQVNEPVREEDSQSAPDDVDTPNAVSTPNQVGYRLEIPLGPMRIEDSGVVLPR